MASKSELLTWAALLLGAVVATPALAQSPNRDLATEEANRKLVVEFYDRIFNKHEVEQAATLMADDYKQHNPHLPDGKAPFVGFFRKLLTEQPTLKARIVRSAADGDFVWLHTHGTMGGNDRGQAIVDIFRVKNGKIVEHWDVLQDVPENANNNNTMF